MTAVKAEAPDFTQILLWLARGLSLVSVFIMLLFVFGEGFNPTRLNLHEAISAVFFFGVIAGLVIGWWKEGWGGAITTFSLLAFYTAHFLFGSGFPRGWAFITFASPGFLFLAYCLFTRAAR